MVLPRWTRTYVEIADLVLEPQLVVSKKLKRSSRDFEKDAAGIKTTKGDSKGISDASKTPKVSAWRGKQ
jgi:hypothetical protein